MSDSVRPHRRQPTRLPRPWDSPGKNTGVGCHFLLHCMKVKVKSLSRVRLLATPWTAAYQAPPSMGFSRQEYWSGVPLPSLGLASTVQRSDSASYIHVCSPFWTYFPFKSPQCIKQFPMLYSLFSLVTYCIHFSLLFFFKLKYS